VYGGAILSKMRIMNTLKKTCTKMQQNDSDRGRVFRVPAVFPESKFPNGLFPECRFIRKSENPKPFFPNDFFPTVIVPEIKIFKNLKMLL
jgi:hypothetical protein